MGLITGLMSDTTVSEADVDVGADAEESICMPGAMLAHAASNGSNANALHLLRKEIEKICIFASIFLFGLPKTTGAVIVCLHLTPILAKVAFCSAPYAFFKTAAPQPGSSFCIRKARAHVLNIDDLTHIWFDTAQTKS
ncbi:hypothetical protein [Herminiimonas sp. CN]|uniref:hypothetical protein n=1 Tax=Herminiimonas sp. CN TaxID=1349818 RepID=UPI00138DE8D2|nr:hypothetical protein [Herminiimonas sp. CN]